MEKERQKFVDDDRSVFVDEYSHLSPTVIYSPVSVPGPGVNIEELESQLAVGCNCVDGLCIVGSACECLGRYGNNYNEEDKLLEVKYNGPVVECNSTCACYGKELCGNRVVQKGPLHDLEVYECPGKGKALKSISNIERGTFVCEYAGEILGDEEAMRRMTSQSVNDMNYIFHLKEHLADGSTIHTYVDPTYIGNVGRYINHSCDPNCIVVPVRVDSPIPKLGIFSCNYIPAGEEITFNYGLSNGKFNVTGASLKTCLCGKSKCQIFLPSDTDNI